MYLTHSWQQMKTMKPHFWNCRFFGMVIFNISNKAFTKYNLPTISYQHPVFLSLSSSSPFPKTKQTAKLYQISSHVPFENPWIIMYKQNKSKQIWAQDVFLTSYVRPIYILCPGGIKFVKMISPFSLRTYFCHNDNFPKKAS